MEYHVPQDDYKSFRRKRFFELLGTGEYVDGATDYCLLLPFAEEYQLDVGQRVWLAFLYGLSYSGTTAIRLFHEFPRFDELNPKKLKQFWADEKDSLWFNPDKKYLKLNDQVVPAIKSFYVWCKATDSGIYDRAKEISESSFDYTYKQIQKHWQYFGPHGAYLFFDAIFGLLPDVYIDPIHLDWLHCGKTVTEGMAHLLYRDECIETGKHDYDYYNTIVDKIAKKSGRPKVIIESTLCAYRKLFKQTRYAGYYADRMLEECHSTQGYLKDIGIDIWQYRKATIPQELLGEVNGWKGIRKDLCKIFMKTGNLTDT